MLEGQFALGDEGRQGALLWALEACGGMEMTSPIEVALTVS